MYAHCPVCGDHTPLSMVIIILYTLPRMYVHEVRIYVSLHSMTISVRCGAAISDFLYLCTFPFTLSVLYQNSMCVLYNVHVALNSNEMVYEKLYNTCSTSVLVLIHTVC